MLAIARTQQSRAIVNTISTPARKLGPQQDKITEVAIDSSDPSKILRIGAYLDGHMKHRIIAFLRSNASTFAWKTDDMKGIDPAIVTHELNVDPTFNPIRQKRRKLGPHDQKQLTRKSSDCSGLVQLSKSNTPSGWPTRSSLKKTRKIACLHRLHRSQ